MTMTIFTSFDYISNLSCRQYLLCLLRPDRIDFLSHLQNEIHCEIPLEHCPLKWLVFPEYPILYSYFQFIYLTNRSRNDLTPDFICFNGSRCPKYLFCSIDIGMRNGLHCCNGINITRTIITMWFSLQNIFPNIFRNCFETTRDEKRIPSNLQMRSNESPKKLLFGYFCDGHQDLPYYYNNETDTDESDCYLWPCNNPYTRCNQYSSCLNGLDELNCSRSYCSSNELFCEYDEGGRPAEDYCISVLNLVEEYINIDTTKFIERIIHINNINKTYLFWNENKCITIKYNNNNKTHSLIGNNDDICLIPNFRRTLQLIQNIVMKNKERLCHLRFSPISDDFQRPFLQSLRLGYFPSVIIPKVSHQSTLIEFNNPINKDFDNNWYCNRGFPILYKNNQIIRCLCPPSYFGLRCQWQNQRISLTIQLKYYSFIYEMPIFQVIIMLLDDQGEITPYYEQIIYVPKRDCGIKYNLYLLYPNRPKNNSINYSIRIDIFNRITLKYWSSWYFRILFPFLPVNRISTHLLIPLNPQQIELSCSLSCGNYESVLANSEAVEQAIDAMWKILTK
ncbi:hypothetical protein I4U23_017028 [Adineta vaga]|nr:hypothetical protein I4U23_017028 [Adineta vaga]